MAREPDNNGLVLLMDDGSTIEFDVIMSAQHEFSSDVASYPVELGGERVYRVHQMPLHMTVDALVSSIDIVDDADDSEDRDLIVWDRLQYLRNRAELFTLQTPDSQYDNIIIVNLLRIENRDTTETLSVTIEFQQANLGMLEEIEVPAQYVSQPSGARKGSQRTVEGGWRNPEGMSVEEYREAARERFSVIRGFGL